MLQYRLKLRLYILIAYVSIGLGALLGLGLETELVVLLTFVAFIIGIICHFSAGDPGYYISITLNSFGIGLLVPLGLYNLDVEVTLQLLLQAVGILIAVFQVFAYLSNMIIKGSFSTAVGVFYILGCYILLLYLSGEHNDAIYRIILLLSLLGLLYVIAFYLTLDDPIKLLPYSSVASFSLLIIAGAILALVALAQVAGGSSSSSSSSKSRSSRSSSNSSYRSGAGLYWLFGSRRHGHYGHYHYYDDPFYYWGYSRRRREKGVNRIVDDSTNENPNKDAITVTKVQDQNSLDDIDPYKKKVESNKTEKKDLDYDVNEWDI